MGGEEAHKQDIKITATIISSVCYIFTKFTTANPLWILFFFNLQPKINKKMSNIHGTSDDDLGFTNEYFFVGEV